MQTIRIAVGFSNCLGNFMMMTSALKLLRQRYPDAVIDMITDKFSWDAHPAVRKLAKVMFHEVKLNLADTSKYDKVYVGEWSAPRCLLGINGAKKISWSRGSVHAGIHEVWMYLNMIGANYDDFDGFLLPNLGTKEIIDRSDGKPVVALANSSDRRGSGRGDKTKWNGFGELTDALLGSGCRVALVGLDEELAECNGENFVGKLNIVGTMKLLSQCDVLVCPDMGLMHVADALNIPIVILAGPTPMTKSAPMVAKHKIIRSFISCAPCFQSGFWNLCKKRKCMDNITVDMVLPEVFKMLPQGEMIKRGLDNLPYIPEPRSIVLGYDVNSMELVYDPSHDRIGDLFGATLLLKRLKELHPEIKISWFASKQNTRDNSEWFDGFNVLDWVDFEPDSVYDKIPDGVRIISSRKDFSVWATLSYLGTKYDWYPTLSKRDKPDDIDLPDEYVVIHVLRRTKEGERFGAYVARREMDIDKYSKLCRKLVADGHKVVRIGHPSDHDRKIRGILDLSDTELSLDTSLRILSGAKLLISGDTGHKFVACAMGIPSVVEIDDHSKAVGGLGGCNPEMLHALKLGVDVDTLYDAVSEVLDQCLITK